MTERLDEAERIARLRLFRSETVGPVTFYRLLSRFKSAQKALAALPTMTQKAGRAEPIRIISFDEASQELENLESMNGRMIVWGDDDYPKHLSHIDDAPPVLSVIGKGNLLNQSILAIVGARNASANACRLTEKFTKEIAAHNWIIASGLARGVDTAAHRASVDTGTIAVLAGGIDQIYPTENTNLYHEIAEKGCLVSEMPFGTAPTAHHFPRRNRIVSGLSKGVLVVEAGLKSGSLITARMAAEQGRDVFAVPGFPGDPRAAGPNSLIQNGAKLVTNSNDILQELAFSGSKRIQQPVLNGIDEPLTNDNELNDNSPDIHDNIMENLSHTPLEVDALARSCQFSIQVVQSVLLDLELAGQIQRHPGNRVSRVA